MTDDTEVQNRAFGGNGINAKTWEDLESLAGLVQQSGGNRN